MITPRRVATVCVGVSDYPAGILEADEKPLRFAASSARELHAVFRELWPDETSRHVLRMDGDATWEAIRADIEGLRREGAFDLFLSYFAGHGRRTADGFVLVLSPGAAAAATITSTELDDALTSVQAATRVVLLDACYSGVFVDDSSLLRGTVEVAGIVASARRDQRSWEDPLMARTLFADAILHGLSADARPTQATIDVHAELCPFVAEYVTRHAYALKAGSVQEPIWASVASAALVLPRGRRRTRVSLTTRQALVRRTRQILAAVAIAAVILLLGVSVTTWRPALNTSGFVELRAGPKWLSPLNVGPWARRIETDIQRSDLVPPDTDPTVIAGIQDERGLYPWFGSNRNGLRRWIDAVQSWLTEDAALRWRTRLDDPSVEAALLTTGRFGVPTVSTPLATRVAAERALLRDDGTISDAWKRQWRERDFGLPCRDTSLAPDARERAELFAETTTPEQNAAWIRDLAMTARASDSVTFEHVRRLIEHFHAVHAYTDAKYRATLGADEPLTARRIARVFDVRPNRLEREALGDLVEAVAVRRAGRRPPLTPAAVVTLFAADAPSCADWAVPALARLGPYGAPAAVSAWARTRASSDQGRGALTALARYGALPASDIDWILGLYDFGRAYADTKSAVISTREWLASVAEYQPLPLHTTQALLTFAQTAIARGENDVAMDALTPVAWSVGHLPPPMQATYRSVLRSLRGGQPLALMNDGEIELWGIAGRRGVSDDAVVRTLVESAIDRASPPSVVFETTSETSGVQRLAAGWKLSNVVALARMVRGIELPPRYQRADILRFFERTATDGLRANVSAARLRDIFDAIVDLRLRGDGVAFTHATVLRDLRAAQPDAARRAEIVEVTRAHLRRLADTDARAAISGHRALWRAEREPDVKYALATLLLDAAHDTGLTAHPRAD